VSILRGCLLRSIPRKQVRRGGGDGFFRFVGQGESEFLEERRLVGAKVQQTAHVVWDGKLPLAEAELAAFSRLLARQGFD
jgi:hypothetical protein